MLLLVPNALEFVRKVCLEKTYGLENWRLMRLPRKLEPTAILQITQAVLPWQRSNKKRTKRPSFERCLSSNTKPISIVKMFAVIKIY